MRPGRQDTRDVYDSDTVAATQSRRTLTQGRSMTLDNAAPTRQPLFIAPDQRPAPLAFGGLEITVLAPDSVTGGNEVFFQSGPEGSGPGSHLHPWDETFYVTSGEITFGIDGDETVAGPGTLVFAPGGTAHSYRFGTGGGAMISTTSSGNASRMYEGFAAEAAKENSDSARFAEVGLLHGQHSLD